VENVGRHDPDLPPPRKPLMKRLVRRVRPRAVLASFGLFRYTPFGQPEVPRLKGNRRSRLPRWTRNPGPVALVVVVMLLTGCGLYAMVDLLTNGNAAVSPTASPTPPGFFPQLPPTLATDAPVGIGSPAAGGSAAPAPTGTRGGRQGPPSNAPGGTGLACLASFRITDHGPTAFQAEVVIINTGGVPLAGWTASWTFPNDQHIQQLWNGQDAPNGPQHAVTNIASNGTIASGASTSFGFVADWTGANNPPTVVTCQPRA
jgi:hypothetical protein